MDPQRDSQERTTPTPPPKPAASASEPHGGHEEREPEPAPAPAPAPAPEPPSAQTTAFRKPVPLPGPISMPAPAHIGGTTPRFSASPPQTPSILRMPSPPLPGATSRERENAVAGPSDIARPRQRTSPHHSSDEERVVITGSENAPAPPHGTSDGHGNGNGNGRGHTMPTPATSIRRPTRAASGSRPGIDRHSRSITLADPEAILGGNGYVPEINPAGHVSRASVIDHVVPNIPGPGPAPPLNGHRRRQSMALSAATSTVGAERTVEERLEPTLAAAREERDKAQLKAKAHSWAQNCAIGAQVVLGALTTGVAAATTGRQTSIATSVLGGMSTLAASYLAKARGSGEPERSTVRCRDLESFLRDCQAFVLDKGYMIGPEYDTRIDRYRRRFEEIMGSNSGAVGDQVQTLGSGQKEKTTLPV